MRSHHKRVTWNNVEFTHRRAGCCGEGLNTVGSIVTEIPTDVTMYACLSVTFSVLKKYQQLLLAQTERIFLRFPTAHRKADALKRLQREGAASRQRDRHRGHKHCHADCPPAAIRRSPGVQHSKHCIGVIGWYIHVANHAFTTRNALLSRERRSVGN